MLLEALAFSCVGRIRVAEASLPSISGKTFCASFTLLPSFPHLGGGRRALDLLYKNATRTSMLLSPCRHHQWEILLPPALHQPPLLLRSIFKQRQNSRATSVCRAWQVRAGPQRGTAQLSFGEISGESMGHGLPGPEFEKNALKIVLELCSGFHM